MAAQDSSKVEVSGADKNGGNGKHRNGVPNIPIHRPGQEKDRAETHVTFTPTSSVKAAHPPANGQTKVRLNSLLQYIVSMAAVVQYSAAWGRVIICLC